LKCLRWFTPRVNWWTDLTSASSWFLELVSLRLDASFRITVAKHNARFVATSVNANRMMRLLEWKLPVGYFFRVTAAPTCVDSYGVTARESFSIRFC
jgi:hypothetical protein